MVLTFKQVKWLMESEINPEQYHYFGGDIAPESDRKKLKELDAQYFELYGWHLVDNYREI